MKQRLELTWFNKDKALIPTEQGRYGYTWVSPNDPRYNETHTFITIDEFTRKQQEKESGVTYAERAELEPQTENLLILGESGDTLEALTRVPELADQYVGKVKCIYIDPPFNTAQTFANYEDNLEHSVWLTMMRDRLIHLHKILSEDGSIWVHLDDVENHRMRVLLDEIFGSGNFLAEVVWQKSDTRRNDAQGFSVDHDVILVYRKSSELKLNSLPRTDEDNARFSNPDSDVNGPWWDSPANAPGAATHQGMVFAIQQPITGELIYPPRGRHWNLGQSSLLEIMSQWADYETRNIDDAEIRAKLCGVNATEIRQDVAAIMLKESLEISSEKARKRYSEGNWPRLILRSGGEGGIGIKGYIPTQGNVPQTLFLNSQVGSNRTAKSEIKALFPDQNPFATPKPEKLLERIIHLATNPGDIVLDIFAGSATTAAVAQKMGRKWVTCELVEDTFENFTRPRLEMVVKGEDMGGISKSSGERIDNTPNGLPNGFTPEEAQKFTSLLNKIIADDDSLKRDATVKTLKTLTKTKKTPDTVNWRGGGGFTVAKLSPTCFDYNEELDLVTLTEHATGQTLINSVAAQLRFYLTPNDRHFHGQVGIQHLVVIEGVLDNEKVDDLMSHLPQGHCLVLAATIINEETRDHVRSFKNGSRVVSIPHDLFTYSKNQEVR